MSDPPLAAPAAASNKPPDDHRPTSTAASTVTIQDAPPPTASPSTTGSWPAAKKKKNKKKKKNVPSISVKEPGALDDEPDEGAVTPTIERSPLSPTAPTSVSPSTDIAAPSPQAIEPPHIDFSAPPSTVSKFPREQPVFPIPDDLEEQPDFGEHSRPTDAVHQPVPGVPAPMPPHASSLFADDAERAAFEFGTEPVDEFEVENPACQDHAMPYESTLLQSGPAESPYALREPIAEGDFERGAFDSTETLDMALDREGLVHNEESYIGLSDQSCAEGHAPALVTERVENSHSTSPAAADREIPPSQSETAPASTAVAVDQVEQSHSADADAESKGLVSPAPAVPAPVSLFDDEAEAIAFEVPTQEEILTEGAPDELGYVAKPMPHNAAALFADEAESEAFGIGWSDYKGETKDPEGPSPTDIQSADTPAATTSGPALTAQALFADDNSGSFDIPVQHDNTVESAPTSATAQLTTVPTTTTTTKAPTVSAPMNAASLFAEADDNDAFDIGALEHASEPPAAPQASVTAASPPKERTAMSLFTSDSDFLVDTSFDDSLNLGRDDEAPASPPKPTSAEPFSEPLDFEVPEGWYDDNGTFQWYTPEEKEAVRQSMLTDPAYASYTELAKPENDSRRASIIADIYAQAPTAEPRAVTPAAQPANPYVPAQPATPSNPYEPAPSNTYAPAPASNPYAPPTSVYAASNAYTSAPSNPYAPVSPPQVNPYASAVPPQGYSAYQPAAPAQQPQTFAPAMAQSYAVPSAYAPAAVGYSATSAPYDPYAPQAVGYGSPPAASSVPVPMSPKAKVEPPKRMKATAYDAPFLNRLPKSRTSSASHPSPVAQSFVVPPDAPPVPAPPSAPSARPVPTPGPPKRSQTSERVPSYVSAGAETYPRAKSAAPDASAYDPPVRAFTPSASQASAYSATGYGASTDAYAPHRETSPPIKQPQRPATASATHPPKPTAFDPPMRPTSSRPPSRHAQRPDFASPPTASAALPPVPPIPSQYAVGPSKGAHSPASYAPPPSQAFSPPPPPPKALSPHTPLPRTTPSKSMPSSAPPPTKAVTPPPDVPSHTSLTSIPPPPSKAVTPPPVPHATVSSPPRAPPRAVTPGAPPRVSSPLRHESTSSISFGQVAESMDHPSPPKQTVQAISVHEEFDPEGGSWNDDENAHAHEEMAAPVSPPKEQAPPEQHHTTYSSSPVKQDAYASPPVKQEAYSQSPVVQETHIPPAQETYESDGDAYSPASPIKRDSYQSYVPQKSKEAAIPGQESSPFIPEKTQTEAPSGYAPAPYLPDAPKETSSYDPTPAGKEQAATEYNPYAAVPASPKPPSQFSQYSRYAPPLSPKHPASSKPPSEYNPYGAGRTSPNPPSEYSPYAPPASPKPPSEYKPYVSPPVAAAARSAPAPAPAEYNRYAPTSVTSKSAPASQPPAEYSSYTPAPVTSQPSVEYNPYAPSSPQQQTKPVVPPASQASVYNPYAPSSPQMPKAPPSDPYAQRQSGGHSGPPFEGYGGGHERKSSTTSAYQPYSAPTEEYNPYAPSQPSHSPQASTSIGPGNSPYTPMQTGLPPVSNDGGFYAPANMYGAGQPTMSPSQNFGVSPGPFQNMHLDSTYVPQQVLEQRPVSEDPLSRCSAAARNVPIAKFGFGGYLVTGLPGSANDSSDAPTYGYGSYRGMINIRPVSEVIEASALSTTATPFPGPLIFNQSIPKGSAGDKKRRESVLTYLAARAEEIERGLPYLKSSASRTRREEEAKLAIVRILTALVEGDGRLFGSSKAEDAVRAALAPPSNAALVAPRINGLGAAPVPTSSRATTAQLSRLSAMIMAGDKRDAAQFAAQAGLWSHALVISSSVDPELWREIVTRFAHTELAESPQTAGLRAAYTVYAGLTPANIGDLFKAANITDDPSADQWREVIAAVVFNGKPTDLISLDDLGARFKKAGLQHVSHVCALLSPNSPFIDLSPAAADRPVALVENDFDDDALIFAEIAEYARTLVPTPKGTEAPFPAMAQLLPYKLQRAWRAAELGNIDQAKEYCEAVEAATEAVDKTRSLRLPPHLAAGLEDLLERLTGEPSPTTSKNLRSLRRAKSSATLGSWIEGRLTKFIAGEEDGDTRPASLAVSKETSVGPFSHFSAISASPGPSTHGRSSLDLNGPPSTGSLEPPTPFTPSTVPYSAGSGGYQPWGGDDESEATPHAAPTVPTLNVEDQGQFINPMGNLMFGGPAAPSASVSDYAPPDYKPAEAGKQDVFDDDDEDMGFGNASLSRNRTPKSEDHSKGAKATDAYAPPSKTEEKKPADKKNEANSQPKIESKGSWLGKWWGGKKEGPQDIGSGYTKANLGEDMAMVYDPQLKRYVMKGQTTPPAAAATPPPPPRAQTASPMAGPRSTPPTVRANTTTPSGPPAAGTSSVPPLSRPPTSGSGIKTPPSSGAAPRPPPTGGPPSRAPPAGLQKSASTAPSLDDLLSRPSSGRPTSAAAKKKRASNKYVDVFQ